MSSSHKPQKMSATKPHFAWLEVIQILFFKTPTNLMKSADSQPPPFRAPSKRPRPPQEECPFIHWNVYFPEGNRHFFQLEFSEVGNMKPRCGGRQLNLLGSDGHESIKIYQKSLNSQHFLSWWSEPYSRDHEWVPVLECLVQYFQNDFPDMVSSFFASSSSI